MRVGLGQQPLIRPPCGMVLPPSLALPKPRPLLNEPFTKPVAGAALWQQARDEVLKKEQLRDHLTNILRKPERIHTGGHECPARHELLRDRRRPIDLQRPQLSHEDKY